MMLGHWLLSAWLAGILGGGHCLVMCGGIASFLGINNRPKQLLLYHLGRLCSYGFLGFVLASGSSWLPAQALLPLRWFAALLLLLMGLYLLGKKRALLWLERLGQGLFKQLKPLTQRYIVPRSLGQSLMAGVLWGFLPCGLVYASLGLALATAVPWQGALVMLAFGLGTLPLMLLLGLSQSGLQQWLAKEKIALVSGWLMIAFALWTLLASIRHLP